MKEQLYICHNCKWFGFERELINGLSCPKCKMTAVKAQKQQDDES